MKPRKRKDRGAQFIHNNLELLGFGNRRDALVQAVKELFENALDATQSLGSDSSRNEARLELLRVKVRLNRHTDYIDIVCADTGSGMRAHQIKTLCCNAFETTKGGAEGRGRCSSGKYGARDEKRADNDDDAGVGLKAAMLYSQLQASDACLKIATTTDSDGILYVQLRINPDSEETAVVKKVAHFVVDENHHHFSGTEMRLSIPCPQETAQIASAADTLALYFQSLRYIAPPSVGVQFDFDVGNINTFVECLHREDPIDRFVADLGASANDIFYATSNEEFVSISCLALMLGDMDPGADDDIDVCLLRFANHAPLINGDDFFLCGATKGVCTGKLWKKYGLRCQRTTSHLVNQLVVTPLRAPSRKVVNGARDSKRLVLAVDLCVNNSEMGEGIKYGGLKKSTLDVCYAAGVQTCCQAILQQLVEAGRLWTPQQRQNHDLVENFAPLISKSVAAIVKQSQLRQKVELSHDFSEELILRELQAAIRNW
ncbi:hypothetical protein PsorP6_012425 [Peronosclerospora sorghi]|uniref:Uncharacterized protein n=1 Tax=Peronosclerospora sorghi TaxID=230839 RepID=A0ACC0WFB7_9STRA|nr:hypothetical protein PsorP6_012425 [Peronosclerospora sorghi]